MCISYPRKSAVFADSSKALCRCTLLFCSLFNFPWQSKASSICLVSCGRICGKHLNAVLMFKLITWPEVLKVQYLARAVMNDRLNGGFGSLYTTLPLSLYRPGWHGAYRWSNQPLPWARTMPNQFFKHRWASLASKEGAITKKHHIKNRGDPAIGAPPAYGGTVEGLYL